MSAEIFTYDRLLNPNVNSVAHFSFMRIPQELRTSAYDLRLLNGGANQAKPYSAEDHQATTRWIHPEAVQKRMLSGGIMARIAISEAALRNYGGGGTVEEDRRIQEESLLHIADCATKGIDVRVITLDADTRGAGTHDFMVVDFSDQASRVVTYGLVATTMHDEPRLVGQIMTNFEEIWDNSLPKDESIDYLRRVASEL